MQKIIPCLWFDDNAEEAVKFYTSIFKHSKMDKVMRDDASSAKVSGRPEGSVLTVSFVLEGQEFVAMNGGPAFKFTEAISFIVNCKKQEEVDDFWEKLSEGGDKAAQQCGWLKDKYGVSWQIVPTILTELLEDTDVTKAGRVMQAMLQMKKIVIEDLKRAYNRED